MSRFHLSSVALAAFVFLSPASAQERKVALKIKSDQIDFWIGEELVTSYRTGDFARPIFWPLHAPGGIPLTRAWPMEKGQKGESTIISTRNRPGFVMAMSFPKVSRSPTRSRGSRESISGPKPRDMARSSASRSKSPTTEPACQSHHTK